MSRSLAYTVKHIQKGLCPFVGRIDLSSGRMEYCNAGYTPLVVVAPDGGAEFLAAKSNVVAGFMDGHAYAMQETTFEPGTMLLAYTDGVTEAERADREQYGNKRLLAFASAHAKDAPAGFVENLERDLDAFTAGAEQSDDITALAVLVGGNVEPRHLAKGDGVITPAERKTLGR